MQPGRLILIVTFLIGPWLMNPLGLMEKRTNSFWDSDSYCVAAAAAKSLQSCPTLCDPIDGSLPGSPVPGTLQARTLGWVAISFSNAWKWKVKVKSLSRVWLLVTPWTAAYQALLSMGFSRQEYWSGVPLPSPSVGENVEKIKRLCTVGENVSWCNHYGKQCQSSLNIVLVFGKQNYQIL